MDGVRILCTFVIILGFCAEKKQVNLHISTIFSNFAPDFDFEEASIHISALGIDPFSGGKCVSVNRYRSLLDRELLLVLQYRGE